MALFSLLDISLFIFQFLLFLLLSVLLYGQWKDLVSFDHYSVQKLGDKIIKFYLNVLNNFVDVFIFYILLDNCDLQQNIILNFKFSRKALEL